jgi:hypothetical protein
MREDTRALIRKDLISLESAPRDVGAYGWMHAPEGFGPVRVEVDRRPPVQALSGPASPVRRRYVEVRPIYVGTGYQVGWDTEARVVVVWGA